MADVPAPGPRGYPLVGVFPALRRDPLGLFVASARRYGEVVSLRLGHRRAFLLSHPDDLRHVLEYPELYVKTPTVRRVHPLFGDSLTAIDGERWQRQRRCMRPAFRPGSLVHASSVVTGATAEVLDRWRWNAEHGKAVDMLREMTDLTRTIIVRLMFGDVATEEIQAVGEALQEILRHANRRLWSAFGWPEIPTSSHRRFEAALRNVETFISTRVARARAGANVEGTLLSALLDAQAADLCSELKGILFAGYTTTASALAWTMHALSTNSAACQSLLAELREVLAGRVPGGDDLPALVYTRMVTDEVLRLYPPTWVTARTPLQDDQVRGYRIPAGAIVLLSPFVTHRLPAFWQEPDRFDPERFRPGRPRSQLAYFPFGSGPRSCIGSWLASTELQLVIAMIAQRYHFELLPGCLVGFDPGLTLLPSPGLPMMLLGSM
jgi:cytochrome P450